MLPLLLIAHGLAVYARFVVNGLAVYARFVAVFRGKGAAKRPSVAAGSSNSSTYTDITQSGESGADSAGVVDESASPLRAGTGWPRRSHRDAWTGARSHAVGCK